MNFEDILESAYAESKECQGSVYTLFRCVKHGQTSDGFVWADREYCTELPVKFMCCAAESDPIHTPCEWQIAACVVLKDQQCYELIGVYLTPAGEKTGLVGDVLDVAFPEGRKIKELTPKQFCNNCAKDHHWDGYETCNAKE